MVYLVFGNQSITIKNRENKIVDSFLKEKDDFNLVRFDGENVNIQDAIDEASSYALGYDKKVVIVDNCYFLLKPKPKNKIESTQDYQKLIRFIKSKSEEVILILSVVSSSVDTSSEIYKALISSDSKVFKISEPAKEEWDAYVYRYFKEKLNVNISKEAIKELNKRIGQDVALFQNTAQKLALYTDNITFDDVCFMVARPLEENAYLIYNHLMNKRNNDALLLYKDLRVNNVEPITLISMLANQFRLLNEVLFLAKKSYSSSDIASSLSINPYRADIIRKQSYFISEACIHETLEKLFQLDLNIKSGQVDRFYSFELFLINFKIY